MQPPIAVRAPATDLLVIGLLATGQERLRAALRRVAADPELLALVARIVVVDAGRTPSATVLREAVRLPAGLLRVVRRPDAGTPEAVSTAVLEALGESRAASLLLLDDVALTDPRVVLQAFEAARRSPSSDVIGLRDPAAPASGPASWWGALLPLDALRAVGAALPDAREQAIADLVLRAEATGYRSTVLVAAGPVPRADPVGGMLLAMLHGPVAARTPLLLREAARLRLPGRRREALSALLGAPGPLLLLRLWLAWPGLRSRVRTGALDRASVEAWAARLAEPEVNPGLPRADDQVTGGQPTGLRSLAWSTRRRTSAA